MTAREFKVTAIGTVSCSRSEAFDDNWDAEQTQIELDMSVLGEGAATALGSFSHIEVLYVFDQVADESIVFDARHPRGNTHWPLVGILAQRGKNRPNKLGVTICEVIAVDEQTITVRGLDAIDGTPVIDIKPVMSGFLARTEIREPDWAREIMASYW